MNRQEKTEEIERLKQDFQKITSAFLVDFRGMKVVDATDLRRQIHKSQGEFKVIKNTLASLAAKDLPLNVWISTLKAQPVSHSPAGMRRLLPKC